MAVRRCAVAATGALLPMIAGACGRGKLPADLPGRLAGCYALYDHRGRPASDSLYWAPSVMRLETDPAPRPPGKAKTPSWAVSKVAPQRPAGERNGMLFWTPDTLSADSIHVVFSSGFSGTELTLPARAAHDTLIGRAREFWDFGPPFDTDAGRVKAVRVRCG